MPYQHEYKAKKLVGTLHNKKNYIVHYQLLKLYLNLGLQLKKIGRVLVFKQSPFMHNHITYLAKLRATSTNNFEKNCLKLLANCTYGKMIENPRKYIDVKICQSRASLLRAVSSPFFQSFKIYNENLAICFLKKKSIIMRSCHAIGLSIFDYSKLHMYDLYYNEIIPSTNLSPENNTLSIIMSDTDSFLFSFKGSKNSFLNDIEHIMDFSNYPKSHHLYSSSKAGQLGYLKDEMCGEAEIQGAIALKSKCYSIKTEKTINKC